MGAVLHCQVCKGFLRISHSHSHLHSHDSGDHNHSYSPGASDGHIASRDDELLPISSAASNGSQPLPTDGCSDVQLLVNAEDEQLLPAECMVQPSHKTTNVNIRAAMVHVIGDLIQSVGVFIAAIIVLVKVCFVLSLQCVFCLYWLFYNDELYKQEAKVIWQNLHRMHHTH